MGLGDGTVISVRQCSGEIETDVASNEVADRDTHAVVGLEASC
jgi:hypothetical protein